VAQNWSLRQALPQDSDALARLAEQCPDNGRVSFSRRYHAPLYDVVMASRSDSVGVVAQLPADDRLIGAAWVSFGRCRVQDADVTYALLNSLAVHPDYRRMGVATELTRWRLDRTEERRTELVLAGIQTGNVASLGNAHKWANQITRPLQIIPLPMRTRRPTFPGPAAVSVREVRRSELDQLAGHLNAFYDGYNLTGRHDAASLAAWLDRSPLTTPVNHYLVAVAPSGRLLAGVGVHEEPRLLSLHVDSLPALPRLANHLVRIVPPDKVMRNLPVQLIWFSPGQLEAARYLWQSVRWQWRDRGSSLVVTSDPRSVLRGVIQRPVWMPTTSVRLAVRSNRPLDPERLLDPPPL
jgi:ribosomal protein S18 acetylase RimI-like enzyme